MTNNRDGISQNRDAVKAAKKDVGDFQYKTNHLIEMYKQYSPRNKANIHLTVGKQRL